MSNQDSTLNWTKYLDESTGEPMWFSDHKFEASIVVVGEYATLKYSDISTNYPCSYPVSIKVSYNLFSIKNLMDYAQNYFDKNVFDKFGGEEKLERLARLNKLFFSGKISKEEEQERLVLELLFNKSNL